MIKRAILLAWTLALILLVIYSYGHTDLNLTLSSHPQVVHFINSLQEIVYFNRAMSGSIFLSIFISIWLLYFVTLILVKKKKLNLRLREIFALLLLATLAYPMFSHDVFNYMFHAKILLYYGQNPHFHAPLEYQGDLWLRFMHWVHTPSAYGPIFTIFELPPYILGFGKFVPALYLTKFMITAFFAWCIYLVKKIGKALKLNEEETRLSIVTLGLNPFLILELVVNSHNDAVMIALILSAYVLMPKYQLKSLLHSLLSVGVKFVTAIAIPALFIKNKKLSLTVLFGVLLAPVLLRSDRFQPWYLIWSLIPAAVLPIRMVRIWYLFVTILGTLYYYYYVTSGFWDISISMHPFILFATPIAALLISLIVKTKLSRYV